MITSLKYKLIILFVLLFGSYITPAFATEIAYVNGEYVFENIKVWKKFQSEIKAHSNKVKDLVIKKETEVETIWLKINKLRDEKGDLKKIAELEAEFKKKSDKLQQYVRIQKKKMDNLYLKQQKSIRQQITKIIENIASEKKLDLVINVSRISLDSTLVYAKSRLDITEKVLKKANQNIKKIIVDLDYKEGI